MECGHMNTAQTKTSFMMFFFWFFFFLQVYLVVKKTTNLALLVATNPALLVATNLSVQVVGVNLNMTPSHCRHLANTFIVELLASACKK